VKTKEMTNTMNPFSSPITQIALGLCVSLSVSTLFSGCGSSNAQGPDPASFAIPVTMLTASEQPYMDSTEFMAQVNSKHSTDLHPQVSSRVEKVLVTDGQLVQAGQPLYQLDISQQAATVNSLDATRQATLQEPKMLQKSIEAQKADLAAAQADLAFNQKQLERYQALLQTHTVSARDTEQYETTVQTEEDKVKSLTASIASQQIRRKEAVTNISRDTATLQSARANLAYYTMRAPFTGNVGTLLAKVGDVVTPTTVLTTLTDNRNLEIDVAVSADYRSKLHIGTSMELFSTMDERLGEVQVSYISPKVDPMTQTLLVKAKTVNLHDALTMDQRLKARLIWSQRKAVLIPITAMFNMDGQPFVYRAETSKSNKSVARMQAIQVGPIIGEDVVVTSGLKAGQTLITGGIQKLHEGVNVAVRE
jgi:multidrug efflux pump subunit AcrA (membrane-fusion protein)